MYRYKIFLYCTPTSRILCQIDGTHDQSTSQNMEMGGGRYRWFRNPLQDGAHYLIFSYLILLFGPLNSYLGPNQARCCSCTKNYQWGGAVYMSLKVRSKLIIVDSVLPNRTHEIQYIVPTSVVAWNAPIIVQEICSHYIRQENPPTT